MPPAKIFSELRGIMETARSPARAYAEPNNNA